jgi:hypothetical protein
VAVERLAGKAVLGEAPEDLIFTLEDLDRGGNFFAPAIRECPSERGVRVSLVSFHAPVTGRPAISRGLTRE